MDGDASSEDSTRKTEFHEADIKHLIDAVKLQETLWKRGPNDAPDLDEAWKRIVPDFGGKYDVADLRGKWAILRDYFKRIIRNNQSRNWPYFQQMTFIEESYSNQSDSGSSSSSMGAANSGQANWTRPQNLRKKRKLDKPEMNEKDDYDFFLEMIAIKLRKVPRGPVLEEVKCKIYKLIEQQKQKPVHPVFHRAILR